MPVSSGYSIPWHDVTVHYTGSRASGSGVPTRTWAHSLTFPFSGQTTSNLTSLSFCFPSYKMGTIITVPPRFCANLLKWHLFMYIKRKTMQPVVASIHKCSFLFLITDSLNKLWSGIYSVPGLCAWTWWYLTNPALGLPTVFHGGPTQREIHKARREAVILVSYREGMVAAHRVFFFSRAVKASWPKRVYKIKSSSRAECVPSMQEARVNPQYHIW
jgi:hypothetical protein